MPKQYNPKLLVPEATYLGALAEVNKLRLENGAELLTEFPAGEICSGRNCPIARSLSDVFPSVRVSRREYVINDADFHAYFDLPEAMQRFVYEFDNSSVYTRHNAVVPYE